MATLLDLKTAILDISRNHYIIDDSNVILESRINEAVQEIAGGLLLPNGMLSPPLPMLYETAIVSTDINLPYVSLPDNYQRYLFNIATATGARVPPPDCCDYYSFRVFTKVAENLLLNKVGSLRLACVKGLKLYYQDIPALSTELTLMYYRQPVNMAKPDDTVDGIPEQFQVRLIKHYIGKQLANEMVDGTERLVAYHTSEFNKALADMIEFNGIDDAPSALQRKPVTSSMLPPVKPTDLVQ